jgi:hypothetical protein
LVVVRWLPLKAYDVIRPNRLVATIRLGSVSSYFFALIELMRLGDYPGLRFWKFTGNLTP